MLIVGACFSSILLLTMLVMSIGRSSVYYVSYFGIFLVDSKSLYFVIHADKMVNTKHQESELLLFLKVLLIFMGRNVR